jgi:hypothetical protein
LTRAAEARIFAADIFRVPISHGVKGKRVELPHGPATVMGAALDSHGSRDPEVERASNASAPRSAP